MTADAAVIAEQLLASRSEAVRADARRNVLRLVTAAQEALDEVGVRTNSHDIARRAGVGVGTFYRQVGSLDELLTMIVNELLEQLVRAADAALEHADPWLGFADFATAWVRLGSASCGVKDAIEGQGELDLSAMVVRIRLRVHRLVRHAQRAGVLRPDATWRDVASLLHGVTPAAEILGEPCRSDQWRRNLDIVLAGLRA